MSRQSIQAGKAVIVVELAEKATFQFDKLTASLSSRMMAASRSLRNTALNATGGFLMTGLVVRSTLKDFIEFESQMLNLAAKMGYVGTVTAEETAVMKDLSQTILDIGRSSAFTSQEVADAAISLAQAGFSAEELKGSLQGVIDLARGTNYALGESADFVANLVRTFEMFKDDDSLEQRTAKITSLTSQLVKSTRLGTIEIVDLREAFKYAGGTAKNLGVDVETMMGYFVQMSEAGLKASLAGTSINTMMLNLIRNADLIKKKFPGFTIAMKDAGRIDLLATNRQLLALTQNMDVASKTAFFQDIFNIRGARAFTAAMEIDRVEKFANSIRNAGAESRLAAMKMESGAKGGLQRFLSAIEALNIALGKLYDKEITAILNSLAFLVTQFEEVVKKNKMLVGAFLLTPGILAAMAVGSFTLSFVLARLAVAMKAVSVAGKGLRFLGGTMVSSAQGMANIKIAPSAAAAKIAAEIKAYEAQKQKVLALQARIDNAFARAGALQSAAAQQRANAQIASSVTMRNLIRETIKGQAMHAKISRRRNALTSAPALGNAIRDRVQTAQETKFYKDRQKRYTLYAARMNKQQQYYTNLASIAQNRGFTVQARQYQQSANKARRLRMAAQARAATAQGLARASSFQGMTQGLGVIVRTAAVGGKGLATLAASLGRLSVAATRFVFSWNFVGMALNVLLLFGDKIPVVVNAFSALSKGIGGAFNQIAKIGTYAAPSLDLFRLAFDAFLQGDTGTGIQALQTGFYGLVEIIQNQLLAAWNTFMEHVGYLWIFLQKIFDGLKTIFDSIFSAISQIFQMFSAPLFSSLSEIFGAMSGGTGNTTQTIFTSVIQGLDMVITRFAQVTITLNEYLMKFLAGFVDAIGTLVSYTPGTLQAGAAIKRDAATIASNAEMRASVARGTLEAERKKRAKQFEASMNVNSVLEANKRRDTANYLDNQSSQMMDWLSSQVRLGRNQFNTRAAARDAEMSRLQKPTNPVTETAQQAQQRIIQQTSAALADVTARLDRASLQKRTYSSAELKAMYDALPDRSTEEGKTADMYARLGYTSGMMSQQDVQGLEQQKLMLQQQLASMMDKTPYQSVSSEMPKYLQALTGTAMSTRSIYRVDTKKQEDLLQQQLIQQEETNRLLRIGGGVQ